MRSPRTRVSRRGHHGVEDLLTGQDGHPIGVRRVRSALLRLKDIISQDDDGPEQAPLTACSAGRQGNKDLSVRERPYR